MAEFQNQIKNRMGLIIGLLILVLGAQAFFFFTRSEKETTQPALAYFDSLNLRKDHPNLEPVTLDSAQQWVDKYRGHFTFTQMSLYKKTMGLWHDGQSVTYFVDTFYPKFITMHHAKDGYSWGIGMTYFVCMRKDADSVRRPKLGFFWLPVMVNNNNSKNVLDYFSLRNSGSPDTTCYHLSSIQKTGSTDEGSFVYDAGTLWP